MAQKPILSRMSFGGHPIHPVLIHMPMAALLGLVATDLAFIFTGDEFWARAGVWLAGVGAFGGWAAGAAGLVDLVSVPGVRRLVTAWCHSIVAVMLLSLATFNWLIRVGDFTALLQPWGIYISVLTALLVLLAGLLGGQLVYEHAVGVHTDS